MMQIDRVERRDWYNCKRFSRCGTCKQRFNPSEFGCSQCGWGVDKPAKMGSDEYAFRMKLNEIYKCEPFENYLATLQIFADFLADRDDPEEVAARASFGYGRRAPVGISQDLFDFGTKGEIELGVVGRPSCLWLAIHPSWYEDDPKNLWTVIECTGQTRGPVGICNRESTRRTQHNAGWFLGFSPGSVRMTAMFYFWSRLSVTSMMAKFVIDEHRSLKSSTPVEFIWDDGYLALLNESKPPNKY